MRAERLTRAPLEGGRADEPSLALDERLGVLNDRKSAKDGSVSLLSGEAEETIRAAGGLCTDRFAANIVTSALDYADLREGTRLKIGETELEITRVGKSCFAECALFLQGEPCPLPRSCAFARVLHGGAIRQFDEIILLV
jgi:hypothetical protein